jgi:hypothetical protein
MSRIKLDYKQKQKEQFEEEEPAVAIVASILFVLLCVLTYILLVMASV